jgi:hypothetical protein
MSATWIQTRPGIETCRIRSANELIELLRRSNPEWWEDNRIPWVFRGHASREWTLLPSAWRAGNKPIDACRREAASWIDKRDRLGGARELRWHYFPNFVTGPTSFGTDNDDALARSLLIETIAEILPIWEFVLRCDELGLRTNYDVVPVDLVAGNYWMFDYTLPLVGDDFLRFGNAGAILGLAQHHGIPTRLLDWTFDGMTAAFFATENVQPRFGEDLIIWALHRNRIDNLGVAGSQFANDPNPRVDPFVRVVRTTRKDNSYLAAQSGLFTTIMRPSIYFMKNSGRRPDLESFVAEAAPPKAVLRKICIGHSHLDDLKRILHRERVARSTFMPTHDNVAADVLRRWCAY